MNTSELGIFIFIILVTLQVIQNMNRIRKLEWDITKKMDKPPEPTDFDEWEEEREMKPLLTKEELDKVMTLEEKTARKKLFGSEYPIEKD